MSFDPPPPPYPDGCLGDLITIVVVVPFWLCAFTLMGYAGCLFLVSVFCSMGVSLVTTVCVCLIAAAVVSGWANNVGLLPVLSFAISFVGLMTALAAIFAGHGASAAVSFLVALVMLVPTVQAINKRKIERTGGGWLSDLVAFYWYLCLGTFFLGGICLLVAEGLFETGVNLGWEFVVTQNFPFIVLEGC